MFSLMSLGIVGQSEPKWMKRYETQWGYGVPGLFRIGDKVSLHWDRKIDRKGAISALSHRLL